MTADEFKRQTDRLIATYGPAAYSEERVTLIWREVGQLDADWLRRTVDFLIGSERQAPLVQAFSEAATRERERAWKQEREREREDARRFFGGESMLFDEDRAGFFQTIIARMAFNGQRKQGQLSPEEIVRGDQHWESFMSILRPLDPDGFVVGAHTHSAPGASGSAPRITPREVPQDLGERHSRSLPYVDN